jgi:hypothetical protein
LDCNINDYRLLRTGELVEKSQERSTSFKVFIY